VSGLEILAVTAIIGFVICQQVAGQQVRGRRLIVLPAVLTVAGFASLHGAGHLAAADYLWLAAGAAGSLLTGLAFGAVTRLSSRDGVLFAKLPARGLWLWAALLAWRVLFVVLAARTGGHVAASATPLLFTLGLNRLGQAAVIASRAMLAGLPFAPEKDGRTFPAAAFTTTSRDRTARY
jgi:hypothetical protein